MLLNINNKNLIDRSIICIINVFILTAGMLTASANQFVSGLILVLGAIFVYFFTVYKIGNKNFLDFIAVFTAVWIGTIGLAQFRFLEYQKIWETRTWINLILASVCFQIGIPIGHKVGQKIADFFASKKDVTIGILNFKLKPQRLFWISLVATLLASALFIWNIQVKGFVPFFSTMFNAYTAFYTKRMVFVTAACAVSPIAYWCIKKCQLSLVKKILMYLCIAVNTFIIPILQVNRGVFIVAALMLTASVFYLNGKKFLVLCVCLVVTFGFFEVGSVARNYTNEYLDSVFEPTEFELATEISTENLTVENQEPITEINTSNPSTDEDPSAETTVNPEIVYDENQAEIDTKEEASTDLTENNSADTNVIKFRLPAKVSFLYGYFTVSHDNFNEAVINSTEYTYGIRQLKPFNVILRSSAIEEVINSSEYHIVKYNLNTSNLISSAFYDLREIGVAILMILWAIILGSIEMIYLKNKGVFMLAALGNSLTPVALCFFSSWFDNFTFWLFWGTIMLIMFVSTINILPKDKTVGGN